MDKTLTPVNLSWFVKTIRSGARDADGNLPPEVWAEGGCVPR